MNRSQSFCNTFVCTECTHSNVSCAIDIIYELLRLRFPAGDRLLSIASPAHNAQQFLYFLMEWVQSFLGICVPVVRVACCGFKVVGDSYCLWKMVRTLENWLKIIDRHLAIVWSYRNKGRLHSVMTQKLAIELILGNLLTDRENTYYWRCIAHFFTSFGELF